MWCVFSSDAGLLAQFDTREEAREHCKKMRELFSGVRIWVARRMTSEEATQAVLKYSK